VGQGCLYHKAAAGLHASGDGLRIDGVREVELSVELAATGTPGSFLLVSGVHHQLAIDRLHRQVARLKLSTDINSYAEHLPISQPINSDIFSFIAVN